MINLSYSRISLSDIAQKLQLDSPEDAEFIVAKASIITTCVALKVQFLCFGSPLTVHNPLFFVLKLCLDKLMRCFYWSVSSK